MNSNARPTLLLILLLVVLATYIFYNNQLNNDRAWVNQEEIITQLDLENDFVIKSVQQNTYATSLAVSYSYNGAFGNRAYALIKPKFKDLNAIESSNLLIQAQWIKSGTHQVIIRLSNPCGPLNVCEATEIEVQFVNSKEYRSYISSDKDLNKISTIYKKVFEQPINWLLNPRSYSNSSSKKSGLQLAIQLIDSNIRRNSIKAKEILDDVILNEPTNKQAYIELARFHMKTNRGEIGLKKAEEVLNIAYSFDDNYANTYVLRGYVYSRQGKYELAEKDFLKAKKIGTDNLWLNTNWGDLYKNKDDLSTALEYYQKVIDVQRLAPSSNDRAKIQAFTRAEQILLEFEDDQALDKLYKIKSEQFPEKPCILAHWANVKLFKIADFQSALKLSKEAIQNRCTNKKIPLKIFADSLIANWHFEKNKEIRSNYFHQAVAIDSEWASRIYRFSSNKKVESIFTHLISKVDVDEIDSDGLTALSHAVLSDDLMAIQKLISNGANPNKELHDGYTVFYLSLISSKQETVLALMKSKHALPGKFIDGTKASKIAKDRNFNEVLNKLIKNI